jgi:acyl-CoA synthetase (AMP-forming)/AMP-acid ligase II
VQEAESNLDKAAVLAYMDGKIARWWMPDDVVFVEEIPHSATGKVQKMTLRKQFSNFKFSN